MRSVRRLVILVATLLMYLLAAALVYRFAMAHFEGKPRTFLQSIEWAADTFSTTGYGSDTHWSHPALVALVMVVQFSGLVVVPLLIALVVLPLLTERFEQVLPRRADPRLTSHVIVYRYGPAVETLLVTLASRGIPALVAETDQVAARSALESGQSVVFSRTDEEILDVCRLPRARALVANGRDEENAAVILRARQMGFRGDIYAFVENPSHRKPMELAGATSAYTPRHIIAAALAAHASDRLSPRLPGLPETNDLVRREIRVSMASPVAGRTLGEAAIGATTGAVVVGVWSGSRLHPRCTADTSLEPGTVLELVGTPDSLEKAAHLIGAPLLRNAGPFVVAGFGEVGRKVQQLLLDAGEEVRVVERTAASDVDVVGDVLDSSVLIRAGIMECRGIVLALDSDDATLFATVIARDTADDVPVIARVNHTGNLTNIHRAGADFALAISDISGEMLTSRLLGRGARARDEQRRVVRIGGGRWLGLPLNELPLRSNGCSALAVERDGVVIPVDHALRVETGDWIWVCGTADAVHRVA